MERRGDFDLDIGSELGVLQAHGPLFRVVPFHFIRSPWYILLTMQHPSHCSQIRDSPGIRSNI